MEEFPVGFQMINGHLLMWTTEKNAIKIPRYILPVDIHSPVTFDSESDLIGNLDVTFVLPDGKNERYWLGAKASNAEAAQRINSEFSYYETLALLAVEAFEKNDGVKQVSRRFHLAHGLTDSIDFVENTDKVSRLKGNHYVTINLPEEKKVECELIIVNAITFPTTYDAYV